MTCELTLDGNSAAIANACFELGQAAAAGEHVTKWHITGITHVEYGVRVYFATEQDLLRFKIEFGV